jgi:hypothetical protein
MKTRKHKSLHQTYGADAPLALSLGIRDAAESVPMPARFTVKAAPLPNSVVIVDQQTGRNVEVALCNYRGVREVLSSLFG